MTYPLTRPKARHDRRAFSFPLAGAGLTETHDRPRPRFSPSPDGSAAEPAA